MGGGFSSLGLSADLRERVLTDIDGEHRLVTVLFADLTSSVSRTRDLHPEEAARLVSGLLETMVEVLLRYGGRIDRFLGDGLLAVFGIPETHEDDPERAVRAALEIRERADELGLGITAGINTGRVYFGPVGSSLHEELTVMGSVVNLAARLQSVAHEGQILIGPATRSRVYTAFDLRPVPVEVKGLEGPVDAHLAERVLDHPDKVRGIEGLKARLVGRDEELERLEAASRGGEGRIIALVGEAGVGKSRLAAEFHTRFVARGGRWFEGRCHELARQIAYGPIRDLLDRTTFNPGSPESTLGSLRESVEKLIAAGRLSEDWEREVGPFLFALAGEPYSDPGIEQATPAQRRALTTTAISDYLEAVAEECPSIIFIEDLHWTDELTLDALSGLMSRLRSSPLTLLVSYRPDPGSLAHAFSEKASAGFSSSFEILNLEQLNALEGREMVKSLLGIEILPGWMDGFILHRAEGNPLYLEELIRSLIQKGALRRDGAGWQLSGEAADMEVPDSVQALVLSRVDRLHRQARRCAQIASVLGRSFARPLMESIADRDLGKELETLTNAGIVFPERLHPYPVYTFVHGLSQQSVYDTLLPSRRAELHGIVARNLEGWAATEIEAIAYHYEKSRNHPKAVEYLLAAGERAMGAFVTDAALEYLDRGLKRTKDLESEKERRRWNSRFHARRGEMLERLARHAEARTELSSALDLGEHDPLEDARLQRLMGQTFRLEGRYQDAHAWYDRAEQALDASPHRETTPYHRAWIEIQKERAFALYFGGREKELPDHNALTGAVVARHGTRAQRVDQLIGGLLSDFRKHRFFIPAHVVAEARRGLESAEEISDFGRTSETRFALGFALLWADELPESETLLAKAVRDARRIGDVTLEIRALSYYAVCLRRLDRPEDTAAAATSALAAARALDDAHYEGHALANLCWSSWRLGGLLEAVRFGSDAFLAWGGKGDNRDKGLDTEFAFLAVWPMVALAVEDDDLVTARIHLRHLKAPWERAVRPDLGVSIERALRVDSSRIDFEEALRLAYRDRLI